MNRNNKILENTYFNLSKAGAYVGPDKLHIILKSKGITHIGKHKVRKWLQNQDNYSLRREQRRKWLQSQDDYSLRREQRHSFRKVRVVVSDIEDQFDMDLADTSNISDENDGIKYLLFVIDIFSKYLWVEPLKNKTAKDVVKALQIYWTKVKNVRNYVLTMVKNLIITSWKRFWKMKAFIISPHKIQTPKQMWLKEYKNNKEYDVQIFHQTENSQVCGCITRYRGQL